jgi:hypothetical protein
MAITTAIAAAASAGAAVYSATQSPPKPPAPLQAASAPQNPLFRRSKNGTPVPKAALGTLLTGDGSAGGVASSSLLGS